MAVLAGYVRLFFRRAYSTPDRGGMFPAGERCIKSLNAPLRLQCDEKVDR